MNRVFEIKKIRVTTTSPIHIGSVAQRLTPFEYIKYGDYIYQISDERLSIFLQDRRLIDLYISAVSKEEHRFRLMDFFKKNNLIIKEKEISYLTLNRKTKPIGDTSQIQDYRPFIRDGNGKVYIPGTALKGSIRTAILYTTLKRLKEKDKEKFNKRIVRNILTTERRQFKKRSPFSWLQREFLEGFKLSGKSGSPHTDWLRMLHIRDGYPENLKETFLIPVNILKKEGSKWNYKKEESGHNTVIWIEVLPEGTRFEFELIWDRILFERFKSENPYVYLPSNIDEIISSLKEFTGDVIDFEKGFTIDCGLAEWYRENLSDLRIGFGSGLLSTTIALLLPEDVRKRVRNLSGKNKGDEVAPKSRRVWIRDGMPIPLGWAVMEVA